VGGDAQIKAMKKAVGTLKGDLSQFRELESFASFGSELDKVSQAQLDRGYRLVELLKQPLNSPMPVEEQVVSLYAATHGALDQVEVDQVDRFESELIDWFRTRHGDILEGIRTKGDIADVDAFEAAIAAFTDQFTGADTTAPPVDPASGVVLGDAETPDAETPDAGTPDAGTPDVETPEEIGSSPAEPAAVDPATGIAVGDVDEDR
jgi:F-type H+-transporting ATPase subunit alpha